MVVGFSVLARQNKGKHNNIFILLILQVKLKKK